MSKARRPKAPLQEADANLVETVDIDLTDLFALVRMLYFARREAEDQGRQKAARLIEAAILALPESLDDEVETPDL
jgi:hypothetical protein